MANDKDISDRKATIGIGSSLDTMFQTLRAENELTHGLADTVINYNQNMSSVSSACQ